MLKTLVALVLPLLFATHLFAAPAGSPPLPPNSTLATTPLEHTFSPQMLALHKNKSRLIRVGWFDISGIFEQKNNVMTGYAAALLQAFPSIPAGATNGCTSPSRIFPAFSPTVP